VSCAEKPLISSIDSKLQVAQNRRTCQVVAQHTRQQPLRATVRPRRHRPSRIGSTPSRNDGSTSLDFRTASSPAGVTSSFRRDERQPR
jgi:hypothetical protein